MTELYPLKFEPVLLDKIWGGNSLAVRWGKEADLSRKIGESWELSGVAQNLSIVKNGFLAGNNIEELIEVYMGDIVGDEVYEKFGVEFPLLIKFIEAATDLSIQVHPDDILAKERHNAYGKTEMWYILEAGKNAMIYSGFVSPVSEEEYLNSMENESLETLLNKEYSKPGDVFFTPAGRIHSIGAGNVLVEIQQTSDITYRIFDWNRNDENGKKRELHTDLATAAIDFSAAGPAVIRKEITVDKTENLVSCPYFITNILHFSGLIRKDYNLIDSFIIYICIEGEFLIHWDKGAEVVNKGETILLPAMIRDVVLEPKPEAKILEVFINPFTENQKINEK